MLKHRAALIGLFDTLKSYPVVISKFTDNASSILLMNNVAGVEFEVAPELIYGKKYVRDDLSSVLDLMLSNSRQRSYRTYQVGQKYEMILWAEENVYEQVEKNLTDLGEGIGFWEADLNRSDFAMDDIYVEQNSNYISDRAQVEIEENRRLGIDTIKGITSNESKLPRQCWFYYNGKPEKTKFTVLVNGMGERYFGLYSVEWAKSIDALKNAATCLREATTNLPNVNYYKVVFPHLIEKNDRFYANHAILVLRIENLKGAFSLYGGQNVQQLFRTLNDFAQNDISEDTIMFFISKEELGMIVPYEDECEIGKICNKIFEYFETPWYYDDFIFFSNIRIGVATYPAHGHRPLELLKNAEIALNSISELENNMYSVYSEDIKMELEEKLKLQGEIKNAIDHDEFEMYLQAQVDMLTRKISGVELLVRWNHREKGILTPGRFLPVAEEMGSIYMIDQLVIHKAAMIQSELKNHGLEWLEISINLSAVSFNSASLAEEIIDIIEMYDADPSRIVFELTETMEILDDQRTQKIIASLHDYGFLFAIDDFGKGYSSLNYLVMMPFDQIKIDKLYIDQFCDSENIRFLVQKIVDISNHYGLKIVAEGIETEVQYDRLMSELQEDLILQGYLFHKPQPLDEFVKFVKEYESRLGKASM